MHGSVRPWNSNAPVLHTWRTLAPSIHTGKPRGRVTDSKDRTHPARVGIGGGHRAVCRVANVRAREQAQPSRTGYIQTTSPSGTLWSKVERERGYNASLSCAFVVHVSPLIDFLFYFNFLMMTWGEFVQRLNHYIITRLSLAHHQSRVQVAPQQRRPTPLQREATALRIAAVDVRRACSPCPSSRTGRALARAKRKWKALHLSLPKCKGSLLPAVQRLSFVATVVSLARWCSHRHQLQLCWREPVRTICQLLCRNTSPF